MTNRKASGRRVKSLRVAAKLSQDALAAEIGISRSTLAGIETGGDQGGIATMVALADYFKVPSDWLLCREVPPGGPLLGKFVDDPDKLALLDFWEGLTDADRAAALRLWGIPPGRSTGTV